MNHRSLRGGVVLIAAAFAGCQRTPTPAEKDNAPVIPISQPVTRAVADYVDYTGRTVAKDSVEIKAQVTGYITQTPFQEGAEVKKGDLLVQIDPAPYQALLDQAQAQVALNEASFKLAETTYARDKTISGTRGAVSQQQLDQDKAAVDEAKARIEASKSSVNYYKLNLGYTHTVTPIDGMVGRYFLTVGNLVTPSQTLTTVVSLDPMYVYFDMDELTLEKIREAVNAGEIARVKDRTDIPLFMGLQTDAGRKDPYPHKGRLNFVNNQVNPGTGTIAVRGEFGNATPKNGIRLLSPGMFVRVRLPIGNPKSSLLVVDRAIGTDQGLKFVYVVDADDKIQYRRITTGPLQDDGLRVIDSGLKEGDWVVVGGLPQIRPNMVVKTDKVAMPTLAASEGVTVGNGNRPQPPPSGEGRKDRESKTTDKN